MSGHAPDFTPTLQAIPGRNVPGILKKACIAGMVIGFAIFAYGFFGGDAVMRTRAQGSFLTNFMYFNGIAQGGFVFAAIGVVSYGRWLRRFKRIQESFALYLPISMLMLIVFFAIGGIDVYPWYNEEMPTHKHIYFDTAFFYGRLVAGLGILTGLSLLFVKHSLGADLYVATEKMKKMDLEVPTGWAKWTGKYNNEEEASEGALKKMMFLAPFICILYAYLYAMISVDVSMSLAPHWYANMFPAWHTMSAGWSGLVWTGIIAVTLGKWLGTTELTRRKDFHDLGKLSFAFCMFWGYTTFAHYLPIWYGNMTEEIGYILIRTHSETWSHVTMIMMVLCFAAPWTVLLSRGIKKIPHAYLSICIVMAIGLWLERFVVNMASVHTYHMPETGLPLGLVEIGTTIGFLGLFILVISTFLSKFPGATLSDEFMNDDPDHVEIHPASAHH